MPGLQTRFSWSAGVKKKGGGHPGHDVSRRLSFPSVAAPRGTLGIGTSRPSQPSRKRATQASCDPSQSLRLGESMRFSTVPRSSLVPLQSSLPSHSTAQCTRLRSFIVSSNVMNEVIVRICSELSSNIDGLMEKFPQFLRSSDKAWEFPTGIDGHDPSGWQRLFNRPSGSRWVDSFGRQPSKQHPEAAKELALHSVLALYMPICHIRHILDIRIRGARGNRIGQDSCTVVWHRPRRGACTILSCSSYQYRVTAPAYGSHGASRISERRTMLPIPLALPPAGSRERLRHPRRPLQPGRRRSSSSGGK